MKIKIQLQEGAFIPKKATEQAAAYDVFIPEVCSVVPGRQIVPLRFALELPDGFEAKVEPRSGFSSKGMEDSQGFRRDADVITGKVDADYRGCVGVIINSHEKEPFCLASGTRIAQLTIYRVEKADFEPSETLSQTKRGNGGFGHSGSGNTI